MPHALVAGAGIAGPALAHWLHRYGWEVTIVERADGPREGGQNVDVHGAGREVTRRMGLEQAIREYGTGEAGTQFLGEGGRVLASFPVRPEGSGEGVDLTSELEILRGDLAHLLVEAAPSAEVRYGDHIVEVLDEPERATDGPVAVRFASGSQESYDLVVAADGIGSATRRFVVGDEPVLHPLGLESTWATIPRLPRDTDWWRWYTVQGGILSLRPDRHGTMRAFISRTIPTSVTREEIQRRSREEQVAVLRRQFAGAGWEAERLLDALASSQDLYVELVAQVQASRWSRGQVVLLGDAGYAPSPITGMGTSLAIVGAYVLAGELASYVAIRDGLAAYERVLRPFVAKAQSLPPGVPRVANPTTRAGVALFRSGVRMAGTPVVRYLAGRLRREPKEDFALPDYRHLEVRRRDIEHGE